MTDLIILNRNLRLHDNPAMHFGSLRSNYLVIYLYDKTYWKGNGKSMRQLKFSNDCLAELNDGLKKFDSKVNIFEGTFNDLKIWIKKNFNDFFIHINHCTDIKYFRDGFSKFTDSFPGKINVYNDFGLQLNNFDRDSWSRNWNKIMDSQILENPKKSKLKLDTKLLNFSSFSNKVKNSLVNLDNIQKGGSSQAYQLLESFLSERCKDYRVKMSSPIQSEQSCSRLSPHFTFGSISIREVYQILNKYYSKSQNKSDLYSFKKRLYWHCHFIQKLHTEPELEFYSMHRMCDQLRLEQDDELIDKWFNGETGFPFLDACMKYLHRYGWINFRMRAMIMSFASYNLWQPWQKTSPLLAQLFTDYEPGIHISQVQMQSGVTGINLPRIYSVSKQSEDQDPDAIWIKSILPQLNEVDPKLVHTSELNNVYIPQIIDLKSSARDARERIWSIRKSNEFKKEAAAVYIKHGSRKKRNFRK
jgi:deoxyribodipyrimidine photo-lyase